MMKRVPLKIPHVVYDPAVSAMVLLSQYTGRICIVGHDVTQVPSTRIMETIPCNSIPVAPPNPIYINVSDFIDVDSLNVFVLLAPTTRTDSQLIADITTLMG